MNLINNYIADGASHGEEEMQNKVVFRHIINFTRWKINAGVINIKKAWLFLFRISQVFLLLYTIILAVHSYFPSFRNFMLKFKLSLSINGEKIMHTPVLTLCAWNTAFSFELDMSHS